MPNREVIGTGTHDLVESEVVGAALDVGGALSGRHVRRSAVVLTPVGRVVVSWVVEACVVVAPSEAGKLIIIHQTVILRIDKLLVSSR